MCYRMMKLFDNFALRTSIQNGNFVALESECMGYDLVALKAAERCRGVRRGLSCGNGEMGIFIT